MFKGTVRCRSILLFRLLSLLPLLLLLRRRSVSTSFSPRRCAEGNKSAGVTEQFCCESPSC